MGIIILLIYLALIVLAFVSVWKVYTKAGKAGWKAFIPIYNVIVFLQIVGKPWWWIFLMMIPFFNIIISTILLYDLSRAFGKGAGFALGLIFLLPIFFAILGFGSAQYVRSGEIPGTV